MMNLLKNEMILEDLLSRHGISHVVFSADGLNSNLYQRVANNSNYTVFHAVDERSAAYYAMGISIEIHAPVAVVCRSNVNAGHFYPAATEAFYQNLPLLMLVENTGEMVKDEVSVCAPFESVTRTSVHIGAGGRKSVVEINKTLEMLSLWGGSPVFLSYTSGEGSDNKEKAGKIDCLKSFCNVPVWEEKVKRLESAKNPVLVLGEAYLTDTEKVQRFAKTFGCRLTGTFANRSNAEGAVSPDGCKGADLVITLSACECQLPEMNEVEHWHVDAGAEYFDPYNGLSAVFAAPVHEFLDFFLSHAAGERSKPAAVAAAKPALRNEQKALLALFNGVAELADHGTVQTSCRVGHELFELVEWKKDSRIYVNSSVLSGGAVSSFLGASFGSGRESYLIIDDLSFFNDMNALMTRNVDCGVHILVINTGKAPGICYSGDGSSDRNSAEKFSAWIKDIGFEYIYADSVSAAQSKLPAFGRSSKTQPVVMEVNAIVL